MIEAYISEYSDYVSYWFNPETGEETLELGGKPVKDPKEIEAFARTVFGWVYDEVKARD